MHWILRHLPLLRVCPPITGLSQLRYDWAYEEMRCEQPQPYANDWSLLNNWDISDKYTLTLGKKFDALQEISERLTPNDEYGIFVNALIKAAAECIPTKESAKSRVPWETLTVTKKRAGVKSAFLWNWRNPTNINAQKTQNELTNVYLKEQTKYIQNNINKIRDSVEDRQSRIAWQTVNEVSRRKSNEKAKLKVARKEERIQPWKQHFKNLLGKPPKVTDKPIGKIISIRHQTRTFYARRTRLGSKNNFKKENCRAW